MEIISIRQQGVEMEQRKLVAVKEMAEILNVPVSWIYQRTRLGGIPHIKVGKYVRFHPEEVLESLKKQN